MKLKTLILLFFALMFTLWSCQEEEQPLPTGNTKYVGGIQINEADQKEWARTLTAAGMNLAQVTVYAKQGNWNSDHLWWEDEDEQNVIREIRAIKSQGVRVIMVLRVALQHNQALNKFKWHGMIFPEGKKQRDEWFYRYQYWVEKWAKICEKEGVDIFAIGSEMNALTATQNINALPELLEYFSNAEKQKKHMGRILKYKDQLVEEDLWVRGNGNYESKEKYIEDKIREQKNWADAVCYLDSTDYLRLINLDRNELDCAWRNIILGARQHYSGLLTLAANFDNYNEVSFWDELDCIGVNAYFPLRKITKERPIDTVLYQQLYAGWDTVFTDIACFKRDNRLDSLPIFFTEIGYTPKADCTVTPWQGDGFNLVTNGSLDSLLIWQNAAYRPRERAMALSSLYDLVRRKNIPLLGLCYWKLTSHDYHKGYEPFMLLIGEEVTDELQKALARFIEEEDTSPIF